MAQRCLFSALRITGALGLIALLTWLLMIRMPGINPGAPAPLLPEEIKLREELKADVQKLGGDIGERNLSRYSALTEAAAFIEKSFSDAGLVSRRDSYEVDGKACHNIEVEIHGSSPEIVVVGAHYDSAVGTPGANDNGSGVAGLLALARRFAGKPANRTLRFVAFANEEPPYFQTAEMGSLVYARRGHDRHDPITAMISLETIGYFSDARRSQTYPSPGLGAFYPTTGNFIGLVGNLQSRALVRRAVQVFRESGKLPVQGAALPAFVSGVDWSDQWSFWQHGYRAFMVTDTAPFRYPQYHKADDTPDKLDYNRFALVVSGLQKVIEDVAASP